MTTPEQLARITVVRSRILKAIRDELKKGDITQEELLAVMAHSVGACIAMQDQRTMTTGLAMAIVTTNIEQGNKEVTDQLRNHTGGMQ